jgi:hypothetical protein
MESNAPKDWVQQISKEALISGREIARAQKLIENIGERYLKDFATKALKEIAAHSVETVKMVPENGDSATFEQRLQKKIMDRVDEGMTHKDVYLTPRELSKAFLEEFNKCMTNPDRRPFQE